MGIPADKSAVIDVASGATDTLVAAPDLSQEIIVTGFIMTGDTLATTGVFKSRSAASVDTDLTGALRTPVNGPLSYGNGEGLIFKTLPGESLVLTAATGALTGVLTYTIRP